jgi:YD repeat-containing protein
MVLAGAVFDVVCEFAWALVDVGILVLLPTDTVADPTPTPALTPRLPLESTPRPIEPRFTRFHYDAAGNVQTVHHHDGSKQSYAYNEDHQLIRATSGQGDTLHSVVTFTRNAAGQVLKEEQQFGGKTYTVSSEFDACRFNLTFLTI